MSVSPVSVNTATLEAWGFLLPRTMRQLFPGWIIFSRLPSFCVNPSRLPNLSQLYLMVDYFDEQDMRILGRLPQLCDLWLCARSTKQVVCNTISTTGAAGDDCCLFPKLRRFRLWFKTVQFLPKGDSGGVSFCMMCVDASMLLGSQGMDGKAGVASTLMLPCFQQLEFTVHEQELIKDNVDCGSLVLQYFASLQNVGVGIICRGASAAEVGAAEAALRHAADIHPNRPTLEVRRFGEDEMIFSDAEDEEDGSWSLVTVYIMHKVCKQVQTCKQDRNLDHVFSNLPDIRTHFPVKYLGLPLTTGRLRQVHFQPIIDKVVGKLIAWNAKNIALAGRLTLTKAVLTSQSIYLLTALDAPKELLEEIDATQKCFFWAGAAALTGVKCKVNWTRSTRPTHLGGLEILNLKVNKKKISPG